MCSREIHLLSLGSYYNHVSNKQFFFSVQRNVLNVEILVSGNQIYVTDVVHRDQFENVAVFL